MSLGVPTAGGRHHSAVERAGFELPSSRRLCTSLFSHQEVRDVAKQNMRIVGGWNPTVSRTDLNPLVKSQPDTCFETVNHVLEICKRLMWISCSAETYFWQL